MWKSGNGASSAMSLYFNSSTTKTERSSDCGLRIRQMSRRRSAWNPCRTDGVGHYVLRGTEPAARNLAEDVGWCRALGVEHPRKKSCLSVINRTATTGSVPHNEWSSAGRTKFSGRTAPRFIGLPELRNGAGSISLTSGLRTRNQETALTGIQS